MSGPLSTVLAQMQAGAPTVAEIVRRSGLEDSVVRAAVSFQSWPGVHPPATSTLPSGSRVALALARGSSIFGPAVQVFAFVFRR